jgi:hypothetical protein
MTEPNAFDALADVELTCSAPDCTRSQSALCRHLGNLLAAGPWLCTEHRQGTR